MAQFKPEKVDLTQETTGFSYQNLISDGKLITEVLPNWDINIQLLNREYRLELINLYF